jgi:hypothetical protein
MASIRNAAGDVDAPLVCAAISVQARRRVRTSMRTLLSAWVAAALLAMPAHAHAQQQAMAHPDLSGVWDADFITPLQRPDDVADLIVPADKAPAVVKKLSELPPGPFDPDVDYFFPDKLLVIRGEQRSSMIVEPAGGRLPFTALGKAVNSAHENSGQTDFDNPENRPAGERCVGGLGHPPMRAISRVIPVEIIVTPAAIVIATEDTDSARIVDMAGRQAPAAIRTRAGYSSGHWEGDTLVVETSHIAATDPAGIVFRDEVMLSEASRVIERFTLTSPGELLYQFTVEDPALYDRPWLGEYVMTRLDDRLHEYACHEGNRSMENILLAARLGKQKPPKKDDKKPDPKNAAAKSGDKPKQ